MKFITKYFLPVFLLLFLISSCSYNGNLPVEEENQSAQLASSGEFSRLSPFDDRLMDLTAYLLSKREILEKGNETGINWMRMAWGHGYHYCTNETDYIIVPFLPDESGSFRLLVAKQKGKKFTVFIRESSVVQNQLDECDGTVDFRSFTGNILCTQAFEKGKLVSDNSMSLNRLKSNDIEFGGILLSEIVVTAEYLSNPFFLQWSMTLPEDLLNEDQNQYNEGQDYTIDYSTLEFDNYNWESEIFDEEVFSSFYTTQMKALQSNVIITATDMDSGTLLLGKPQSSFIANASLVQQPGGYPGFLYSYSGFWIYMDYYGDNKKSGLKTVQGQDFGVVLSFRNLI